MDYGRSFTYMLKSGGLGKIIIGALLFFVPIWGWAVIAGYSIRTIRTVASGDERLPEWTGWGDLFTSGLLLWVAGVVYSIPSIILTRMGVMGGFLSVIWNIAMAVWLPAATIRYAMSNNFGAFFEFSQIKDFIQKNLNTYIVVILLGIAAGIIAGFGLILLVIGVLLTSFWALLVNSHLYGQMWRISIGQAPLGSAAQ